MYNQKTTGIKKRLFLAFNQMFVQNFRLAIYSMQNIWRTRVPQA